ncbi:RNA polymerase sigma-70 factor [Pedobacter caeni]|uniref:RNA polymerase sigma-70 factor, ECF subfamily n=1 Tax=Pedobacter caeni TaxID=288992 RepID=A0A1M4TV79_9SPHI|nr:RNA polymerase sigma-70 factor [Pedobacter caeni]SHE48389.1 RNA polymerase sigma-70 factor, ECF subfamily [Pedobacter caeni]
MGKQSLSNYQQLILSASEGDENAFAHIFYEYSPALLSFAKKLSYNSIEAEEIIQNVFLRVWLHRDKLAEVENLKSWLYKFVVNEGLSYVKKRLVRERANLHFQHTTITSDNDIDKTVDLNELKRIVAEAVELLPEQRRKIFNLSRGEELSIDEISEQLNLSPSTVKNTLVTALKFIRNHLTTYGYASYVFIVLLLS